VTHVFFLSYARTDNTKQSKLRSVIADLEERVRTLRGDGRTPLAFLDVSSIDTGQEWETLLSKAAHEVYVLVCMMSASYFSSEWCAKEFDVFRRRLARVNETMRDAIIPVLWDLKKGANIPAALGAFQYDNERFPPKYLEEGLRTLRNLTMRKDAYVRTIDELARRIHEASMRALPPLRPEIAFDDLPRAFDNPGPYNLAVVVMHEAGPQWRVDAAGAVPLARKVDEIAHRLKVHWQDIVARPGLPARIHDLITKDRAAVVVVVDDATAASVPAAQRIAELDAAAPQRVAILIDTTADDDSAARRLFPTLAARTDRVLFGTFSAARPGSLEARLEFFAAKLRSELVAEDPATKVADPALEQAAAREGIAITTRPSLSGPGGGP
jgi:hypothetical protein